MTSEARRRAYTKYNRKKSPEYNRHHAKKSYHKHLEKNRLKGRINSQLVKIEALTVYGGDPPKCACCGETNIGFLTLDHVNSDGRNYRRDSARKSGNTSYWYLKGLGWPKDPPLQVLCFNCNCGRQHNGGICPHHGLLALGEHRRMHQCDNPPPPKADPQPSLFPEAP